MVSLLLNPLLLLLLGKKFTRYPYKKFLIRSIWAFPLLFLSVDLMLAIHPKLMQRLLKLLGVTNTHHILYSVVWMFYGSVLSTGIIDAFCQALVIGNNIEYTGDDSLLSKMFIWSVIVVAIGLFTLSMCCCLDVILSYIRQYIDLQPLTERLMKPRVYKQTANTGNCTICLEEAKEGEVMAKIPTCEHSFHESCLKQWLDYKEACPLCRNEKPN